MATRKILVFFILGALMGGQSRLSAQDANVSDLKAKYIQTMEDMRRVSAAIKNYSLDFGYLPLSEYIWL